MALTFLTMAQQMIFVDTITELSTDANSLIGGRTYQVFFVVQNDDSVAALNVEIEVVHSQFGIGLPGGPSLISPHPVVIPVVPPMAFGIKGQATASFFFDAPAYGHGCLVAQIQPNGATLNQNSTVIPVAQGGTTGTSFGVFGFSSAEVLLKLTESEKTPAGDDVIPLPLWNPVMVPPPGIASVVISPTELKLTGLAHSAYYQVGLQVTVPASAANTHVIIIKGYNPATNEYLGEVQFVFAPQPAGVPVAKPHPYIFGGYQSEDIIITDLLTGTEVMLGGAPGGRWDTLLKPDTDYGFAARIHNSSGTAAVNTVVRFWKFPGGVGTDGVLVDIKSATIPAYGSVVVHSEYPFRSASPSQHACAAVSIYNAMAESCTADAVVGTSVPDPGSYHTQGCSAWRNTDSQWVYPGYNWHLHLDTGLIHPLIGPDPVELKVQAHHINDEFKRTDAYANLSALIKRNGLQLRQPMYLLPELHPLLPVADLGIQVKKDGNLIPERAGAASSHLLPVRRGATTSFSLEGTIPETAKKGDIFLVKVIAQYNGVEKEGGRNVEFLEVLHVSDRMRRG